MFGVETRAWSVATSASAPTVLAALRDLPDPPRRDWLLPGALAPLVRARTDRGGLYLRLSPGDPRRGPGSADRAYVTVRPDGAGAVVEVAQRPVRPVQVLFAVVVVLAWAGATVAALRGLLDGSAAGFLGILPVLVIRGLMDGGRRLDERRLRQWLTARFAHPAPVPAQRTARVDYGPARYDVPAVDCTG